MSPCKYVDCFKLRKGSIVSGIIWSGVYILVYFDFGLCTSVWSDLVWSVSCGLGLVWSGPLWSTCPGLYTLVLSCLVWSMCFGLCTLVWSIWHGLCTLVWFICGLVHIPWSGQYAPVWSDLIWSDLVCCCQSVSFNLVTFCHCVHWHCIHFDLFFWLSLAHKLLTFENECHHTTVLWFWVYS